MPSSPDQAIAARNLHFRALYESGKTLAQVAEECDVSTGTVNTTLKRMGVVRRPVGRPGKTNREDQTKQRWYSIKSNYGLTREQWDAMLVEQCGRCDICVQPLTGGRVVVDHDHVTGKVRGLLCYRCNAGLAGIEDPSFRTAALAYLEKHRER